MTLSIDLDNRYWTTTMKLSKYEVLALLTVLDDPPVGCDLTTVEHLQVRLERIVMRKNPASSELSETDGL